jgi:hypothetical protein
VVHAEPLVVDHSLHAIEQPEPDQQRADQLPVRPRQVLAVRRAPEHEQARDHEQVGRGVEEPVPERVELQVVERGDRVPTAQHVVPLQHLMQHDPVEEPAEPEPEQDAGRDRESALLRIGGHRDALRGYSGGIWRAAGGVQ